VQYQSSKTGFGRGGSLITLPEKKSKNGARSRRITLKDICCYRDGIRKRDVYSLVETRMFANSGISTERGGAIARGSPQENGEKKMVLVL